VFAHGARDERLDVLRDGHVGALEERGATCLLDQRDRLFAVLDVAVTDRDFGSRSRERERRRAADARTAARDHRDLPLEVVHLSLPYFARRPPRRTHPTVAADVSRKIVWRP